MDRDTAVVRIQDGLGFATRQTDKIILRLQEAQRDLELGKTLPKFLLQEDQTLDLQAGTSGIVLPAGFLRIDDDVKPYFVAVGATSKTFIDVKRSYGDGIEAYNTVIGDLAAPRIMVIRRFNVDFIQDADQDYTIVWSYYKAADLLTTNIENAWLANASEWLIGEAGYRIAKNLRDKDAMADFDDMRKTGRAAVFGEIVAEEESSGPLIMGANL